MKNKLKEPVAIMFPAEVATLFGRIKVISLRKMIISNFFLLLSYFSRETTKDLGKAQFLTSHYFCVE